MSTEENKATIRRYLEEAWNRGNVDVIDEVMAIDYARHLNGADAPLNREGQKQRIVNFRKAFPDLHFVVEDMIAEGDNVAFRMVGHATHQGEYMGIPATGKQVTIYVLDTVHFAKGKVVAHWGGADTLNLLQQLGAVVSEG
jgi:steroid delta-isomerase-like uncharacterized protein